NALQVLAEEPRNVAELTTLRRAFHTLKGSSRMVGLNEFGEAAWSLEQVLNTWLADQKPASDDLRALSTDALNGFGRWLDDIAAGTDAGWKASVFRVAGDAMRTEQKLVPIALPEARPAAAPAPEAPAQDAAILSTLMALDSGDDGGTAEEITLQAPAGTAVEPPPLELELDAPGFTLDLDTPAADAGTPAAPPAESGLPAFEFELEAPAAEPELERAEATEAAELSGDELPPEFAAFGSTAILPKGEVPPTRSVAKPPAAPAGDEELPELVSTAILPRMDLDAPVPPQALPRAPEIPEAPVEIAGIDFSSLSAVAGPATAPQNVEVAEMPMASLDDFTFDFAPAAPKAAQAKPPKPAAPAQAEAADSPRDEQVKVIGTLRIGIPLYNVYLNEADEWSRRLATEISEWTLEMNQRVPDSTVGWAHALAGSSATVGFQALSDIARALESALQHTQSLANGTPQHASTFTAAAEEVRRLLHQFAAGFLKDPDPRVLQELHALKDAEGEARADVPEELPLSGFGDLDFTPKPAAVPAAPARPVAQGPIARPAGLTAPAAQRAALVKVEDEDELD
ncbi:MAG TPA: Hpt domain-containing protein, partial [Ramlibacter sp.]